MSENTKPLSQRISVIDRDEPLPMAPSRPGRGTTVPTLTMADALKVGRAYRDYRAAAPDTPDAEALAFAQTALPSHWPADKPFVMALPSTTLASHQHKRAQEWVIDPDHLDGARRSWPTTKLFRLAPLTDPATVCRGAFWVFSKDGTRSITWPKDEPTWPDDIRPGASHWGEIPDELAPQPFVIIDGGAVQNTPSIPVIDYDEIRAMDLEVLHEELARIAALLQKHQNRPHRAELHKSYQYVRELIDDRMGLDSANRD